MFLICIQQKRTIPTDVMAVTVLMMVGIRLNLPAWKEILFQYKAYVESACQTGTNVLPVWSHMSMNNDIQANPIGFNECSVLHTILMVIFCKPEK